MDELIARALDTAQAQGAQYADVRLVRQERQLVLVRNGTVEEVSLGEDAGFGVRALVDGAWGFASSYRTDSAEADAVAGEAVRIARASARVHLRPVQLGEPVRSRGTYRTPVAVDPFAVPLDEKIALLLRADGAMRRVPQITATTAQLICIRDRKTFASTEGAQTEQEIVQTGGGRHGHRRRGGGGAAALVPQQRGAEPGLRGVRVRAADRPGGERPPGG